MKIPLDFENDLDVFVKKNLKPQMYQSPTLYEKTSLSGVVLNNNTDEIYLIDCIKNMFISAMRLCYFNKN